MLSQARRSSSCRRVEIESGYVSSGTGATRLIAEDAYLAREGTRRLLEEQAGIDVVGVAADFDEVVIGPA